MDHSFFHTTALALKPDQPSKPSTYWIAVLIATLKPSINLKEEDFLWVKCHGGIKVGTILDQYRVKHKDHGSVKLILGNKLLSDESMRQLDEFNDQLLAFEAVKVSELSSRISNARLPLQPTNRQVKVEPTGNTPTTTIKHDTPTTTIKLDTLTPTIKHENNYHEMPIKHAAHPAEPHSTELSQTFGRPAWAISNGFEYYNAEMRAKFQENRPHLTDAQVDDILFDRWLKLPSAERQSYEERAKNNSRIPEVKLEPIKAEFKVESEAPLQGDSIDAETEIQQQQSFQLQDLLKDASPDLLESSVEQGLNLLRSLKEPMVNKIADTPDAKQWIEQIDNLSKQAVKTRTVIGVVGNTGAGKSSVINAMLDEERLLPTSCMRACTAVVTEISYNDAEKPYRAVIEFIKPADWEKELRVLFQDLIDSNGNISRECNNPDTDAGVAYAKIKAVYPKKTKDDIAKSSIEILLREVSHVVGTTRSIEETDSLHFYQKLQAFVDSKEKSTGDKEKDKKRESKDMEFWPLIRVVRIYVKSPALQTGAVIVDLPGVHDSNAARAAVAENYMKECTGLWIVAPITRAVDDKAAKTLLGESFKRQLKMDGGFSSVTFICSKTDDISLTEAQESLGLEELSESWLRKDKFSKEAKTLEAELQSFKDTKIILGEVMNDADEEVEVWETLKESFEDGKTVFAPSKKPINKKRKSSNRNGSRKKQRRMGKGDEDREDEDDETTSASDNEADEVVSDNAEDVEDREPLEEAQITAKISEIRATKKNARNQRAELNEKSMLLRKQIEEVRAKEQEVEAEISYACISGRNQYSKGAIQQDFAAGMKEMDEELAVEADEENFNPDVEIRDYEQVARDLPVFCVSSRGYQKLQGRLKKDPKVPGFKSIEETEIPQLQAHCGKLTEKGRAANCKRFINNLSLLLNSLAIWASNDGTGVNMTDDQKKREDKLLEKSLKGLERGLDGVVATTCENFSEELGDNIFDKYDSAIGTATGEASTIAHNWGAPVNRDNRSAGGYHWSTYKAICRRNGVYSNGQGPHEWNLQLCEPMIKVLASGWEKTFSRRIPLALMTFTRNTSNKLKGFHEDVNVRAQKTGAGLSRLHMLRQQLDVYENIFKDLANMVRDNINKIQREINREFTPVIERAMSDAYVACVNECGPGSYARMKFAMTSYVEEERHAMFQNSANEVRERLNQMITDQRAIMSERADQVFIAVRRDYGSALSDGGACGELLPKTQRLVRHEVMSIIEQVESTFKKIIEGDSENSNENDKNGHESPTRESPQGEEVDAVTENIDQIQQEIAPEGSMEDLSVSTGTSEVPVSEESEL